MLVYDSFLNVWRFSLRLCFAKMNLFIFLMLVAINLQAQNPRESGSEVGPTMSVWMSYAPTSARFLSKMSNTSQGYLGIGLNHSNLIFFGRKMPLSSDLILSGWVNYPKNGLDGPRTKRIGLGVIPVRLTVPFTSGSGNFLFTSFSSGVMYYTERFPNDSGTRMNFLLSLGIGYNIYVSTMNLLQIGFDFHHLSNAGVGSVNPGIDSGFIFIRISI